MRILFILLCVFISFSLNAAIVEADKCWLLREADKHKQLAKISLEKLKTNSWYIPDLRKKEHLKSIVTSAVCSCASLPDARSKVLAVGLALIGSISSELIDRYLDLRTDLLEATYHLQSAYFYSNLSLRYSCTCKNTKINNNPKIKRNYVASQAFLQAIDNLTLCDMTTDCINDTDMKMNMSSYITSLRDILYDEFNNRSKGFQKNLPSIAEEYHKNLGGIMAKNVCDPKLCQIFNEYFMACIESLKCAEENWVR